MEEVYKESILEDRKMIERDQDYTYATDRLLLHTIVREVLGKEVTQAEMGQAYQEYFPQFIQKGVDNELLDARLLQYDLQRLGGALKSERDLKFDYLGLQTLYDRYFLHVRKTRIELPPGSSAVPVGAAAGRLEGSTIVVPKGKSTWRVTRRSAG